jgi:hypothetical protein
LKGIDMGNGKVEGVGGGGGAGGASQANWVPEAEWNKQIDAATQGMKPEEKKSFMEELKKKLMEAPAAEDKNGNGSKDDELAKSLKDMIKNMKGGAASGGGAAGSDAGGTTGAAAPVSETQTDA